MQPIWRLEFLGTLQARSESVTISRFRTRRVGLLLAFLATHQDRSHSREELADLLWPDVDEPISRQNLRQALSSLRRHLEPPPLPSGSVLVVKQSNIRLSAELVVSDVGEFKTHLSLASRAGSPDERMISLEKAVALYKGTLLPGHYEEWVQAARQRLEDSYTYALKALVSLGRETGQIDKAISFNRLALVSEPLDEELHTSLIGLYLDSGRPANALKQFKELEELLAKEFGCRPGEAAEALASRARAERGGPVPKTATPTTEPEQPGRTDRPPKPIESKQVRLPVQLTRFHGRQEDLETALGFLLRDETRLVSLLGPAGVGKTRLSQEVARRLADEHAWNVWFVPLADIADGAAMLDAVADVVKPGGEGQMSALERIKRGVKGKRNLIVLDNLEHIIEKATPLAAMLLQEVQKARFLATTRHSLKVEGDQEIHLEPLPVAPPTDHGPVESEELAVLAKVPSIQLFVDRCQAIHPDYQLTLNNARTIAAICDRLEGLPLALEIAAGLSNAFTTGQLLQNLENRLEVLKNRRRDASPRHQSLRAAIDYSYELLSPELQAFFAALSVFRGGFTITAANEVCLNLGSEGGTAAGRRRQKEKCLRALLELQERSLVHADECHESLEARFRLLESFREFGREQLKQEEEERLQNLHAEFYLGEALTAIETRFARPRELAAFMRFDRDNSYAAVQHLLDTGRLADAIRLLDALRYPDLGGRLKQVAADHVRKLVKDARLTAVPLEQRIVLQQMVRNLSVRAGDYGAAEEEAAKALELAQASGSDRLLAIGYTALASAAGYKGDREKALDLNLRALQHARAANDLELCESVYNGIGTNQWAFGDLSSAEETFLKGREASKRLRGKAHWLVLYNLARVYLDQGRLDEAMPMAADALRSASETEEEFGVSMSISMMSRYHWLKGNLSEAFEASREALLKRHECDFSFWLSNAILFHGFLLVDRCEFEASAVLLAATRTSVRGDREVDRVEYSAALEKTKAGLPLQKFESAWPRGLSMSTEEAFEFAISLK